MTRTRCGRCLRAEVSCYCHLLNVMINHWPVRIVQELRESGHPLNTGRIAALGLSDCQIIECDLRHSSDEDMADLIQNESAVLVYPGPDSLPLSELKSLTPFVPRPLVFIDATWRKSYRMLQDYPALAALRRYRLDHPPLPRYRIRKASRPDAVSTLEAIVAALSQLEDAPPAHFGSLLQVMDWMITQQISHIGEARFRRNYPGS
jgi:DTW domain-containing protein